MKLNTILVLFVAIGLLLIAAGCTEDAAPSPVTPEKTLTPLNKATIKITARPTTLVEDFTISNLVDSVSGSGNYKIMTISGRIRNNQNREASFILIQAEQYDKDDVKLAYSNTVINDLSPGETAVFKISIFDQDAINNADHYSVFVK